MEINLGSDFLNFIIRQGYQPGDRLPSIQELTKDSHLDMSANKVREQLEVARQMGWVEVRSKRGTRVKEYDFTPAVRLSALYAMARGESFESFASLRNHVEASYWQEACALLTDEPTSPSCKAASKARTRSWTRRRFISPIRNIASFT